jgi:hypothetical protein
MNARVSLTITALLSIVFSSFHLADDVVRGIDPAATGYTAMAIVAVYLFATLMLNGRRWAHVVVLIGSVGATAVPYLHMQGSGLLGPRVVNSGAVFFWVWTLLGLGVTASVSAVLAARGLWDLRKGVV